MKETRHLKRLFGGAVWLGLATVLFAQTSFGQGFISQEYRPRWFQEYENFGGYDIRKNAPHITQTYPTNQGNNFYTTSFGGQPMSVLSRATYDQFGNYLLPGGTIYDMTYDRSRIGATNSNNSSFFQGVFNRIVISDDEFSNWKTQLMIGQAYKNSNSDLSGGLRAYITPSTMKITNFSGLRWDFSSRKNNVSLFLKNSMGTSSSTDSSLYGVHWQSILGDVLKVGGTFVVHQRSTSAYSNIDIDNSTTGIKNWPRYAYLVLTDDSPEDTDNGARIYDVDVIVNGEERSVPTRVYKVPDILNVHTPSNATTFSPTTYLFGGARIPKRIESTIATKNSWFLDLVGNNSQMYSSLFSKREATFSVLGMGYGTTFAADNSKGYYEATGTDVVIYEFQIPDDTRKLQFKAHVANDYNLDIIAVMYRGSMSAVEANWNDPYYNANWSNTWDVLYDSRNVAKSNGNVKDLSNAKWITVQYDRATGMSVCGLDMEFNWRGLKVNGEINEYSAFFAYPVNYAVKGESRRTESCRAWFVTMEKDFGKWGLGGEVYHYPYKYMQYFGTVDDNDDNDDHTGDNEYYRDANGVARYDEKPGVDADWDQDYDNLQDGRPFLEYYFDDVIFGDDFNHDGTIDAREDDDVADLPYEVNSYGHHFFVKLKPRERSLITAGYYDLNQETRDGRNRTEYVKLEHFQRLGTLGELTLQHRTELINYNSFNTYRFGTSGIYRYTSLKDTVQNTTLLHTRVKPVRNLNIINDALVKVFSGYGDPITSAANTINENLVTQVPGKGNGRVMQAWLVHKVDYTWTIADREIIPDVYIGGVRFMKGKRIKELKIQPMFKFENSYASVYSVRRSQYHQKQTTVLYPILRVDYQVAPKTKLRCGFQGFPGWEERVRVKDVKTYTEFALSEYNKTQMIVALENRSLYQGFNLVSYIGVRNSKVNYVATTKEDTGVTTFFFTIQSEGTK